MYLPKLTLLLIFILASAAYCASFSKNDFIISFWCAPPMEETTDARYAEIKEAGFNVVMPPCESVTVEGNKKILDLCQKYGMKAVLGDQRIMAIPPGDPNFEKNLDSVIADYASHPAFYGYHLTDEPNSNAFPFLAAVSQYLLKKDPTHLPYINLFPNYANEQQLGNRTYEEHVSQYLRQVKNPLLSYDHYSQMTNYQGDAYFANLEIIRRQALSHDVPFVNIILSTPHNPYRNPTEDDLRWQVYTTLAYGAHGILYFTYWTIPSDVWNFHNGILEKDGKRTEHYEQVKWLNWQMTQLAKTLVKLDSKAVYHTAPIPPEAKPIPDGWLVRKVRDARLVIGHFKDGKGYNYLMFVNKDMQNPARAIIEMDPCALPLRGISSLTGSQGDLLKINPDNTVEISLKPGEGRLFIVDRGIDYPMGANNMPKTAK